MNCAKENDEHINSAPIKLTEAATKIVPRLPETSPRKVQAMAPKVPGKVYRAITVPAGWLMNFPSRVFAQWHTLYGRVVMFLFSCRVNDIHLGKMLVE